MTRCAKIFYIVVGGCKVKKKRKLKKRNFSLLILGIIIFLALSLEIGYTIWIITGGPLIPSSEEVKTCFKKHHRLFGDCLYSIANSSDNLVKTEDNNLRYIGDNPNNYLDLGEKYQKIVYRGFLEDENDYKDFDNMSDCLNENRKCVLKYHEGDPILWRIIGVMKINEVSYVKIIRDDKIGKFAWDSSSSDVNLGYGVNEWSTSKLNNLLNDDFYNQKKSKCVGGKENKELDCDFTFNGLNESIKKYLYKAPWHLGSILDSNVKNLSKIDFYNSELGINEKKCLGGEYCTDNLERTSSYEAYLGLMYPSDYLLANSCDENGGCSNWLINNKSSFWTISPSSSLTSNSYAIMFNNGNLESVFASSVADVYPTAYLKREVKIMGGFGTKESPYVIH